MSCDLSLDMLTIPITTMSHPGRSLLDWKYPQLFTEIMWTWWMVIVVCFLKAAVPWILPSLALWVSPLLGYMSFIVWECNSLHLCIFSYWQKSVFSHASDLSFSKTPLFIISWKQVMKTLKYHCCCLSNHNKMVVTKLPALWILLAYSISPSEFEALF